MSDRMKAIKRHLAEKRAVRKAAGGVWVRRGECRRCGQCCNIRLVTPEEYERVQEEARASGQIPENAVLDPVCANYHRQPDGRMGCDLHETDAYPEEAETLDARHQRCVRCAAVASPGRPRAGRCRRRWRDPPR